MLFRSWWPMFLSRALFPVFDFFSELVTITYLLSAVI